MRDVSPKGINLKTSDAPFDNHSIKHEARGLRNKKSKRQALAKRHTRAIAASMNRELDVARSPPRPRPRRIRSIRLYLTRRATNLSLAAFRFDPAPPAACTSSRRSCRAPLAKTLLADAFAAAVADAVRRLGQHALHRRPLLCHRDYTVRMEGCQFARTKIVEERAIAFNIAPRPPAEADEARTRQRAA